MVLFLSPVTFSFGCMEALSQYPYVDMFLLYTGMPVYMWEGRVYLCTCLCMCVLGSSDIPVFWGKSP